MSLSDAIRMVIAGRLAERDRLWHTCAQMDYTLNYGGLRGEDFRPVRLGHHFALLTGQAPPSGGGLTTGDRARLRAKALAFRAERGVA